ncbi:helix-turn-helix domain-containing protein [Variovorax sp. YR216]|uniref:helix-turn-helix domain-containing protein n=1 Tax=Variovorax sp. YR216 TaxID=1882828 RepID=UPI0008950C03|nr:helix-turn-helix transcriptional regulator [Variovorax sp. YR216]SEA50016.1 Helix-turn-helix [Variovorax sp. YR216]
MPKGDELRTFVGARLKEERERLGLSQADFAAIGDASKRTQIQWEKGAAAPNAEFLALVAQVGVDVLYVVTGQRTPAPSNALTSDEAALVENYKHSDEEGRAAARRVLSSLAQSKAA